MEVEKKGRSIIFHCGKGNKKLTLKKKIKDSVPMDIKEEKKEVKTNV